MSILTGSATPEGTKRYRERFVDAADGHFRERNGLAFSSIGLGTYLGNADEQTDRRYVQAVKRAVEIGVNVIDSAINYRFQRSERSVGTALAQLAAKGLTRDELIVATKAGFLSFDTTPPSNPKKYYEKTYIKTGLLKIEDIAASSHSIAPRFLENQLDRSLKNLGIETVDIFYIHNPETQLEEVAPEEFMKRLRNAFEFLESAVESNKIRMYGIATWSAFRGSSRSRGFLNLADIVQLAREAGGDSHHFGAVQLPYNFTMREAYTTRNQQLDGKVRSTLEAAADLGLTVMASASMLQSRLSRNLPDFLSEHLPGLDSDSQRAIQFVRSTPGITTALVGMSRQSHVEENLRLAGIAPAPADTIQTLLNAA